MFDQREDELVDDLVVDRPAGRQRPVQVGAGLLGGGATGPVTAAGELDGGRGEALRRGVPGPGHQPGYILCSPPGRPSRISGAGADPGVHRMPGISPRVNSRSRTPSPRRCSAVNCMVVPFGSAPERRSQTTYRPTVTAKGSTQVEPFTGTTSSVSGMASGKLAVVAAVRQQVLRGSGARREGGHAQPKSERPHLPRTAGGLDREVVTPGRAPATIHGVRHRVLPRAPMG